MKPYVIFGEITCGKTLSQFMEAMKQPFVEQGALMPDAHAGYSLPIGSAVRTHKAVVPAWVGYDIGCGVSSSQMSLTREDFKDVDLQALHALILSKVPVGAKIHDVPDENLFLNHKLSNLKHAHMDEMFDAKAKRAIGTLGGGNHFIEIGICEEDRVHITVHSGSRGFGHAVASYHMAKAAHSERAVEGHHAYTLQEDIDEYIADVQFCEWYAQINRYRIISKVVEAITELTGLKASRTITGNCVHNTVVRTLYDFYIHRKGSTSAQLNETVLIPANMRDGVLVCLGKGNTDALSSSSHGCGRLLSRSEAKKIITNEVFKEQMEGIVCNLDGKVDEAPDAYKDISDVMEAQKDCLKIAKIIKPILNVKG